MKKTILSACAMLALAGAFFGGSGSAYAQAAGQCVARSGEFTRQLTPAQVCTCREGRKLWFWQDGYRAFWDNHPYCAYPQQSFDNGGGGDGNGGGSGPGGGSDGGGAAGGAGGGGAGSGGPGGDGGPGR
jgi:hypothetical protein